MKLNFLRHLALAGLCTAGLTAFGAEQLPFSETFDTPSGTSFTWDHEWEQSSTFPGSYPPSWRVAPHFYVGTLKVIPPAEEGGLAYINTYDYTPESDFMITSPEITTDGVQALEFSYQYYVPNMLGGNTGVKAEISFDNGSTFQELHSCVYDESIAKGWIKAETTAAVPSGAQTALLRITAHNSQEAVGVGIDDIRLRAGDAMPEVYPASVSDFSAAMNAEGTAIDINLTAPTLSHPSLGDVNNEPLSYITAISLRRQIGYATDYVEIHRFQNPAPGENLHFEDTDIDQGGEYSYKAIVYVGERCDYGNYTDNPVTVGQIPGDIRSLIFTTNRGEAPVTLSFQLPDTDAAGKPLRSIAAVAIYRYNNDTFEWDSIERLDRNLVPGSEMQFVDNGVETGGYYEYRLICEGNAGNSYGTNGTVYVGADIPERPLNLKAEADEDGFVHLSWEAPAKGINNGWIDFDNITYTVQRGNGFSDYDADMLAEGVTATTFMDPTTFGDEEIVKYFVKAVSNGLDGYSAISNTLVVGDPSELPFVENFNKPVGEYLQANHSSWTLDASDNVSLWAFAEMAYLIMEGQVMPVNTDGGLAYAYYGPYSTLNREDYMTSGNLNVEGRSQIGLTYHVYSVPGYDSALRVEAAFDGGEFSQINFHDYNVHFTNSGWLKVEMPVDVPENAKTMRIKFTAVKGDYACSVALDNVRVDPTFGGSGVCTTPMAGILVAASKGTLAVYGMQPEQAVTVCDASGRMVYSGKGNCNVSLPTGLYIVTTPEGSVKIQL